MTIIRIHLFRFPTVHQHQHNFESTGKLKQYYLFDMRVIRYNREGLRTELII